jgi:shikimate dehydrogenase
MKNLYKSIADFELYMKTFGIIGYPLTHSFSQRFFTEKFQALKIDAEYINFEIISLETLPELIRTHKSLTGLNVTMPFKEKIIPYLDEIDIEANKTGAVNAVKIVRNGKNIKLSGYNSDVYGFYSSIRPLIKQCHKKALILGTGGAAKAVQRGLNLLEIESAFVSRFPNGNNLDYNSLSAEIIREYKIIINATPVGMYPDIQQFPNIPYEGISTYHLAYDLIYNPKDTQFMIRASKYDATVKNGLEMLILQAEKSWNIWNK